MTRRTPPRWVHFMIGTALAILFVARGVIMIVAGVPDVVLPLTIVGIIFGTIGVFAGLRALGDEHLIFIR